MKKVLGVAVIIALLLIMKATNLPKLSIILTTDPPFTYMVKNMEAQLVCAKKAGFMVKKPVLRMMRPPFNSETPLGLAYMHLNVVVLAPYASYETIAHELGHIIDAQSGRKGHLFFRGERRSGYPGICQRSQRYHS